MNKYKTYQKPEYTYSCTNCDNEFSRDYPVEPETCYDCDYIGSFEEYVDYTDVIKQFCPICKQYFYTSDYLNDIFKNDERAKRQIIRKATDFLLGEGFTPEDFLKLQHTTEETMKLARKKLNKVVSA